MFKIEKRIFSIFNKTLLSFILICLLAACNNNLNPILKISPNPLKMGQVKAGTKKVVLINLENTGTSDLVIDSIEAECGCTEIVLASKIIAPNKGTKLQITYTADSIMTKDTINVKKYVVVRSNSVKILDEITIAGQIVK